MLTDYIPCYANYISHVYPILRMVTAPWKFIKALARPYAAGRTAAAWRRSGSRCAPRCLSRQHRPVDDRGKPYFQSKVLEKKGLPKWGSMSFKCVCGYILVYVYVYIYTNILYVYIYSVYIYILYIYIVYIYIIEMSKRDNMVNWWDI
jgi:hypothetical protein